MKSRKSPPKAGVAMRYLLYRPAPRPADSIASMSTKRIIVIAGIALFASFLIPVPYLACPSWDVSVVNESGRPLEGMTVRPVYQNYSAENESQEEDRTTDGRGFATFPRRISTASLLRRCVYSIVSAGAGVHASFGRHAYAFTFGHDLQGSATSGQYVTDWTGIPDHMQSQIVATPIEHRVP